MKVRDVFPYPNVCIFKESTCCYFQNGFCTDENRKDACGRLKGKTSDEILFKRIMNMEIRVEVRK